MSKYIKKGVELAGDSFSVFGRGNYRIQEHDQYPIHATRNDPPQWFLDALAAQLRKQAQADPHIVFKISVVDSASYVEMIIYNQNGDEEAEPLRFVDNQDNEALAFLEVIIDSKVLEND